MDLQRALIQTGLALFFCLIIEDILRILAHKHVVDRHMRTRFHCSDRISV